MQLISDSGYYWTQTVLYMYSKEKFDWSASVFSNFYAATSLIRAVGVLALFPMFKRVKMGDAIICALGSISNLLWNYFYGIAWAPWVLWMAAGLGCIGFIASITRYEFFLTPTIHNQNQLKFLIFQQISYYEYLLCI